MKFILSFLIILLFSDTILAQNAVLSRYGKEITVNSPASTSTQGQVKLAGDLGGTADAPTVPALTNKIEGSGTLNYIPKFTAGKTLGNSLLFDNGTNVGVGTTSPGNTFEINQGTAGNSGLRFTNMNSSTSATTSSSKVLTLNSTGDVILTNVPGTQNIIDFSVNANPNTAGTTFSPNTPNDQSVVYQSAVDNSLWTYNGTAYVTYSAPSSTAWYTAGTTNDAGSSKTNSIWRSGNVGIGITTPSSYLHVQGTTVDLSVNANTEMFRMSRPIRSGFKWDGIAKFNMGSYTSTGNANTRLDLAMTDGGNATTFSNVMTWQANGNVGINNTAPSSPLVVQGVTGTGALKLIAPSVASGDNWWMGFGHGTTSTDANDRARIGVDVAAGGSGRLFFTTGATGAQTRAMFIDESQRVGIGTSAPLSLFTNAASGTNFVSSNNSIQGTTGISWLTNANGYNTSLYNANNVVGSNGLQVKVANTSSSTIAFEVGQNTTLNGTSVPLFNVLGSGNVGIGTNTPTAQLEVATTSGFSTIIRRANNTNYTSANLILQKTFSTDPAVSTAVSSGDYIGRILFSASNGTSTYPSNGTDIVGYAYGTQTSSTNGGGLLFRTVKDASTTVVERMKIDHNGNVGIGFVSPATGITAPASILDVSSTSSGVLVPRMTTTQRTGITLTTGLKGMLVFDSDVNMFYYNVGTTWSPINVGTIKTITAAYTLLPEDNGRVLDVTSATAITITVPNTLPIGFQVSITQAGAGQVTLAGGTGMTVSNRYSATKTSGQWAKAGLEIRTSSSAVLSGDVL